MDIKGNYVSGMAVIGMQVAQQVAASQAQVVATALEGAQKIAANPPAPAAPGRVDITV
ncbi:hypothetical protein [Azospirillum sp. TSO22-1]|uniref:hypothetical protein n=1 Tax=Azospirillum sp. TSO22-1 TaxID=716789 RepID=UPI001304B6AE|nr:hypothetical protein [Azospirillum sp. TSO22-1]